jgi:hypothetical protein
LQVLDVRKRNAQLMADDQSSEEDEEEEEACPTNCA